MKSWLFQQFRIYLYSTSKVNENKSKYLSKVDTKLSTSSNVFLDTAIVELLFYYIMLRYVSLYYIILYYALYLLGYLFI